MVVTGRTVTVARGKILAAKFFHPGEPHHIAAAPCLYRYAGLPCCSARNNADNAPATPPEADTPTKPHQQCTSSPRLCA